jgi:hypothetical protein
MGKVDVQLEEDSEGSQGRKTPLGAFIFIG